ncbi:Disease resistance protein [Cinnamomum micranthum f. kanehirae]|uniref:Disease resistance protein n=1 Tax=Cinnamomum micranthum f. kanehirae TaxID=337451 RepID=A0A3S3QGX5_9MAGN|nr:Disease resistance protein [Cinnamomum micranthum f. kanehirae]
MSSEAVVPYIVGKLGDLLIQEAQLLFGVREGIEGIKNELEWMQRFLKDADSKQNTNALVKKWVSDIRDVSYEIEDVIETFIYSQRRRHGLVGRVVRYISEPKTRHKVGKQIEQIKQKISDISRRRDDYGIRDINEGRQEASSSRQSLEQGRRFFALLEEPEVVGQQEEIRTLKKQLINGEQRRCVISIFGMGGSGKTTLAREVYRNVKNDFDCHAFVCISQQYEMKDVLIRVITCVMSKSRAEIENLPEDELGTMLRDHLKGKKYLVVIDDIWSKEAWNMLGVVLPNGKDQSRVMLTTRIKDVAVHADPVSRLHEMRLLNDNEGWELFMKKVFPGENPSAACPSELEETGRKIFKKCGGLPLAILVIGGLLARKDKSFHAWHNVLHSVSRHLTESDERCMEILAWSYFDLPHYLKPCFLYFGLFLEDYEIGSGRLIRLWIAEGFIEQRHNEIMEDVAEGYLEELVGRSMIQASSKKSNGSLGKCRMHDLLRELSISVARENNFFTIHNDNGLDSSPAKVRRLALHRCSNGYETISRSSATLRSLICFRESRSQLYKLPDTGCKLLRVFDSAHPEERRTGYSVATIFVGDPLPKEVGKFVHLRYLAYYYGSIEDIPSNNLFKLRTLRLSHRALILPYAIWECEQLRYLHAVGATSEHAQLNNLRNLQTLCLNAGNWIEDGLGKLTNLRKLGINGYKSSYHKALPDSVDKLRELRSLKIDVFCYRTMFVQDSVLQFMTFKHHLHLYKMSLSIRMEQLPELPPNIAQLSLTHSQLEQDAISTLEKLSCLKILRLNSDSYKSKKMICSLGGFPRLELLVLNELNLEEWIVEEGALMNLKSVELHLMSCLRKEILPERVRGRLMEINDSFEQKWNWVKTR